MLFTKRIDTFPNTYFGIFVPKKSDQKRFELCQNDQIFTKISSVKMTRYSQRSEVTKCSNTRKIYTLKTLLSKNWFYFFFLNIWHAKIPPSFRMSRY